MHTGFFVITIPIFYFEFVTRIVSYSLVDNFTSIAYQRFVQSNLNKILKREQVEPIIDYMNIQIQPKIQQFNTEYSYGNSQLYNSVYEICGGISALCILLALLLCYFYNVSMLEVILENLIVLGFIVLSEFLIVTIFLNKIEIIDGDFLRATTVAAMVSPSGYACPPGFDATKQEPREVCSDRCDYLSNTFPLNLREKLMDFF